MRSDMSDVLIHFTKGKEHQKAYQNLRSIIERRQVQGSRNRIRDGSLCVCFSEAPLSSLRSGLLNPDFYTPYSPFGIVTTKEYIFSQGGRPVIYQPESEFGQLPTENSWRHVRYEPPAIDFTWEREWRLKTEAFHLDPSATMIIVPNNEWAERLMAEHDQDQQWQSIQYSQVMEESLAMQYEELFQWIIVVLNNT